MTIDRVAPDSTPADLQRLYFSNVAYDVDNDTAMAGRFVETCRAILMLPTESTNETDGVRFNRELVAEQLKDASRWLTLRTSASSTGHRFFRVDDRYTHR